MAAEPKHKKLKQSPCELADLDYRYCQFGSEYYKRLTDYGTGELYSSGEVHTVTYIEEYPGITVTDIAQCTGRSKATISLTINKLEKKGLIRREKSTKRARYSNLYVTPKGLELSKAHKAYDHQAMAEMLDDFIALFGVEAVQHFYDIMGYVVSGFMKTPDIDSES